MVDYAQHWSQRCQRGPFINYSANHKNAVSQHFYCLQNSSIRANRFSKSLEFVIGDIFNHSSDCFPDILFGLPAIPSQFLHQKRWKERSGIFKEEIKAQPFEVFFGKDHRPERYCLNWDIYIYAIEFSPLLYWKSSLTAWAIVFW